MSRKRAPAGASAPTASIPSRIARSLRSGRTVGSGTLASLRHLTQITIEADTADGRHVVEHVEPGELQATLERLVRVGVKSLISRPPTLEELFLGHYR